MKKLDSSCIYCYKKRYVWYIFVPNHPPPPPTLGQQLASDLQFIVKNASTYTYLDANC